jgi:serine/threonine protein phosphatase PrpC
MPHARAQLIGGRDRQCDATAVYTKHNKVRAYVLLDGIGDTTDVHLWTLLTARRLAYQAANDADAEAGLRTVHARIAEERAPLGLAADFEPSAVAVVAVAIPGELLQVAWCGDARAYVLPEGGELRRLTTDHNKRQWLIDQDLPFGPYDRNQVLSYLGDTAEDASQRIGTALGPASGRLLLASDGAYEPLEDSCMDLSAYLVGSPRKAARDFTQAAIDRGSARPDNATALVVDFG